MTQNLTNIDDIYEDARHPSDHRVSLEPAPRDGAPAAWLVLLWMGMILGGALCLGIAWGIAGGGL